MLTTPDYTQTLVADSGGHHSLHSAAYLCTGYGDDPHRLLRYRATSTAYPSGHRGQIRPYYGLLKRGSRGEAVYNLTARLAELGYPISATRSYNDSVVAAVRLFQAANGLSSDGMAGKLTQAALFSVGAISYSEGNTYPTLVRGDRGMGADLYASAAF